jgi:hypothetical protein
MVMKNNHLVILMATGLVMSSLLTACGGGNSGSTTASADTGTTTTTSTTTASSSSATATTVTPAVVATPTPVVVVTPPPPPSRYLKMDAGGNELPANAQNWRCVKDKETGLVWETKTDDGGLQDRDWRYRHFHNFGGYASSVDYNGNVLCQNLGSSSCDAYSYVNALKGTGLCGRDNWRLPLMGELLDLIQFHDDGQPPNIDRTYFADTIGKGPYCSENKTTDPTTGQLHEENYQGVDYGLTVRADNPRGDSMVALRFSGEVQDGLTAYPNANWICYTRLVSGM